MAHVFYGNYQNRRKALDSCHQASCNQGNRGLEILVGAFSFLAYMAPFGAYGCDVQVTIDCPNNSFPFATCAVPGGLAAGIVTKHSRWFDCTLGISFGYSAGSVWVSRGCRATFNVCSCRNYQSIDCDSLDFIHQVCGVPGASAVTYVRLAQQRSKAACILNSSYGIDGANIYVSGCRGRFDVCYN
ncbi:lectin ADEL-like [Dreissena polymorpha]|uniref:lectin ADEL-like n=1 Tax=Dreissena polymorpha TaxID=45954 RepID=UPI0022656AC9|nr:lectin ADEL-like [Dreissena polymorpha]